LHASSVAIRDELFSFLANFGSRGVTAAALLQAYAATNWIQAVAPARLGGIQNWEPLLGWAVGIGGGGVA